MARLGTSVGLLFFVRLFIFFLITRMVEILKEIAVNIRGKWIKKACFCVLFVLNSVSLWHMWTPGPIVKRSYTSSQKTKLSSAEMSSQSTDQKRAPETRAVKVCTGRSRE
jgi:hypothetical protein